MKRKIKNVSFITDNSTSPPTIYKNNEVITIKKISIPIKENLLAKRTCKHDDICNGKYCFNRIFFILFWAILK